MTAMTDRELLELAAKAAGMYVLPEQWPRLASGWFYCIRNGEATLHFRNTEKMGIYTAPWMPLADDGDALRLAVKLELLVDVDVGSTDAGPSGDALGYIRESHGSDPCAATRRAIVRAAADIGAKS